MSSYGGHDACCDACCDACGGDDRQLDSVVLDSVVLDSAVLDSAVVLGFGSAYRFKIERK